MDLGITGWDQVVEYEARSASLASGASNNAVDGSVGTTEGEVVLGDRGNMKVVMDLGFGKCKLQVQVPEGGDIRKPDQLVGKNVVTSFVGLTEKYFASLEPKDESHDDRDGVSGLTVNGNEGQRRLRTKIKYVGGSVEAACALGVADGIVDLVGPFSLVLKSRDVDLADP